MPGGPIPRRGTTGRAYHPAAYPRQGVSRGRLMTGALWPAVPTPPSPTRFVHWRDWLAALGVVRMRIGAGLDGRLGLRFGELRQAGQEAARLGFESLWTP